MSSDFVLSRLRITGKLDESTPLEVILAIADAHCIDYSNLNNREDILAFIEKVNEEDVDRLSKMRKDQDYEKMSHFINPDNSIIWNKEDLELAFTFMTSFTDSRVYKDQSPNFLFGTQTPNKIQSLNECVVYTMCKYYGLELSLETTIDEMVLILRYFLSSEEFIITSISNKLLMSGFTPEKLLEIEYVLHRKVKVNTENISPKLDNKKIPEIDRISDDSTMLNSNNESKESVNINGNIPNNKEALKHKDISNGTNISNGNNESNINKEILKHKDTKNNILRSSDNKGIDFSLIRSTAVDINTYYPTANALNSYEIKTPEDAVIIASMLYGVDISTDKNIYEIFEKIKSGKVIRNKSFNCNFVMEMYATETLNELIKDEGYTSEEIGTMEKDTIYEALQIISLSNTFYKGKRSPYINKETYIEIHNIDELIDAECISFGNFSGYVIFTYKELYDLYNKLKILVDPDHIESKIPLSYYSNKKLKYIIDSSPKEELSIKREFKKLLNEIDNAYNSSDSITISIKELISKDDGTYKEVLTNFMGILVQLSMNMRGWTGNGEYPLRAPDTTLEDYVIDQRFSVSLTKLNVYVEGYPELCKLILSLPLVLYKNGKYIMGDETNGKTIGDRIKIITGPSSNHMSCIKLSSNWLASSSYKYCRYFGIDPKFNIEELKKIS